MGRGHDIDDIDDPNTPDLTEEQFIEAVKEGSWDAIEAPEFVEWLRMDGYDGIITLENGAVNYGIFDPKQAKSVFSRNYNQRRDDIADM